MRRVGLLLSTMGLALLIVSGIALAQTAPGEVPDASCQPTTSGPPHLLAFFRSSAKAAQTFTAEHTGLLSSAQVQVGDFENEPTGIVMEIRTVDSSGTPTGVVLASTQIPASDVPYGQFGVATGHFSPGAPVEAGQRYALVLRTSTGVQILGVIWAGDESIPCPGALYNPLIVRLRYFRQSARALTDSSQLSSRFALLRKRRLTARMAATRNWASRTRANASRPSTTQADRQSSFTCFRAGARTPRPFLLA